MAEMEIDVDGIQRRLGSGRFQIFVFLTVGLIYSRGAWHVFGGMFLAGDPGHWCALPTLLDPPVPSSLLMSSVATDYKSPGQDSSVMSSSNQSDPDNGRSSEAEVLPAELDAEANTLYSSLPEGISTNLTKLNWTSDSCTVSHVTQNGSRVILTSNCPFGWSYGSLFENTVLTEWNLVCDQNFLVELSITIFMVGATVGAVVILPLADRWGRKRVMMGCLLFQACFGTATIFAHSYIAFTVLRFLIGMLNIGVGLCAFVLMTETFPAHRRTVMSIAFQAFWAVGVMTVAGFGYLVRNWRHLELLLTLPNLLALPLWWLLPESLPWLVSKKRWAEAVTTVTTIARINRKNAAHIIRLLPNTTTSTTTNTPTCCNTGSAATSSSADQNHAYGTNDVVAESDVDVMIDANYCAGDLNHVVHSNSDGTRTEIVTKNAEYDGKNGGGGSIIGEEGHGNGKCPLNGSELVAEASGTTTILDLFRYRQMCLYSCVMFFLFFVNSLSYFGISFSVPVLHGNQFANLCIMGAVEIPANIICVVISQRMGRRYPNAAFLLLCGVSNIAAIFCPSRIVWLKLAMVMIGKFAITAAYSTVYLYSAEVFPTAIRNQAMGVSSVFENVGSISAPFIVLAAKSIPEVPLVVFGVLTICGAFLNFLLPETHNRPLPQTVQEITKW